MKNNNKEISKEERMHLVKKLKNLIVKMIESNIFWLGDNKKNIWINRFNRIINFHYKYLIFRLSQIKSFTISVKTFFGFRIFFRMPEHYYFLFWGFFPESDQTHEANLTNFLINNLKNGDIFMDIGANCGFYSVLARKFISESGQVHAFEPTHSTFKLLQKNMSKFKNCFLNEKAVFNEKGHIDFYLNEFSVGNTIKVPSYYNVDDYKKTIVQTITIDDYCRELDIIPTFIKIDVEGGEENVIIGAKKVLEKYNPIVAMEIWKEDNKSHRNAFQILLNLGYIPHFIGEDGDLLKIISNNTTINFDDCLKDNGPQVYDNLIFIK